MQNLALPPQYQFLSSNSDAFGQTEVKVRVGFIYARNINAEVNARMDALTSALCKCSKGIEVVRLMLLMDGLPGYGLPSIPDKLVFTIAYDADDHDAIMEALKPFDDLWEKA